MRRRAFTVGRSSFVRVWCVCRTECRLGRSEPRGWRGGSMGIRRGCVDLTQQFRFLSGRHWVTTQVVSETEHFLIKLALHKGFHLTPAINSLALKYCLTTFNPISQQPGTRSLVRQHPFGVWDGKTWYGECYVLHTCQRFAHPEPAPLCIVSSSSCKCQMVGVSSWLKLIF